MGIGKKIFLMPCILFAIFFTVNIHAGQEHANAQSEIQNSQCVKTVSVASVGDSEQRQGVNNPIKPEIAHKMKKLQIPFIANDGQADETVKFYANTFAGSVFVTKDGEIVYSLPGRNYGQGAGNVGANCRSPMQGKGMMHYGPRVTENGIRTTSEILNLFLISYHEPISPAVHGERSRTMQNLNSEIRSPKSEMKTAILKEELIGAKISHIKGEGSSATKVSYFKGNDPSKWKNNIATYEFINLGEVYKGIDLKLKAYGNNVEKLFTVKPGANPGQIKIRLDAIQPPELPMTNEIQPPESPFIKGDSNNSPLDFVVSAQSNEKGARGLSVNDHGELVAETELGAVKFTKPVAYQMIDGKRVEVECGYVISDCGIRETAGEKQEVVAEVQGGKGEEENSKLETPNSKLETENSKLTYSFTVASYDTTKDLIIDPLLASTFLGGGSGEYINAIAIDKSGNIYVTGATWGGFPVTDGAYDIDYNSGHEDVFVSKFSSDLTQLIASTYLGSTGNEYGTSIAIDTNGNVYVGGYNESGNFPTTADGYDTSFNGGQYDCFLSKFNGDLVQLLASTYLGGVADDVIMAMSLDSEGNVYVTGQTISYNFPTTAGAYDTSFSYNRDGFISQLDKDLTKLLASTYLGGNHNMTRANGLTLDAGGNVYVTGFTKGFEASDFPVTADAYDTSYNGPLNGMDVDGGDVFISKLNGALTAMVASTYLGGSSYEKGISVALDKSGNVYVAGGTESSDFPVTDGAYDTLYNGKHDSYGSDGDVFVSKLSGDLKYLFASTYLGGAWNESGRAAIDTVGNVYVVGATNSPDFPTTVDAFQSFIDNSGNTDGFISKLNRNLTTLLSSTYLGDGQVDSISSIVTKSTGDIYVAGHTTSPFFPTMPGSYDTSFNGSAWSPVRGTYGDAFVSKFFLPNSYCNSDYLSISKMTPETGGDTGSVTMTIHGCQFQEGATVRLTRTDQTDIEADPVTVSDGGESISAAFDLTGKELGVWDVVVTNPDDSSVVQKNAFTIEEGREPKVWVDIIGRDTIRRNTWSTFYIVCGNSGDVDAIGVPIFIAGIPKNATWKLGFEITPPSTENDEDSINWSEVPVHIETDDEVIIPLFIPYIAPGETRSLKIYLTVPFGEFKLRAWAGSPMFGSPMHSPYVRCFLDILGNYLVPALIRKLFNEKDIADCFHVATNFVVQSVSDILNDTIQVGYRKPNIVYGLGQIFGNALMNSAKLLPSLVAECAPLAGNFVPAIKAIVIAIEFVHFIIKSDACRDAITGLFGGSKEVTVKTVQAVDPNIKVGTQGVSEQKYVSGNEPLKYTIYCENVGTATAAAAEVTITDQLGTATVDLNTFSLGDITFGSSTVTPVAGLSEFSTKVDLRPDKNLIVRIDAGLDNDSGLVIWHLVAIDPDTNDYPEDTMLGVLPPNVTPPEGDGSVVFTIMPKAGLPTGTEVRNKASIVFDVNAAMVTNEWLNTIDNDKPSSHVLPLAARQMNLSFPVYWEGTDVGAGVRDYTVYVSTDGGAYTPWITNGTDTASLFTGAPGMVYAFYSAATDNAGNLEDAPHDADAVTKINIPPVANAGDDQQAYVNGLATLDGGGSSDADGDALSYQWVFHARPSGSAAAFSDETSKTPTFTPDKAGTYTIGLTVNDGTADSAPDTVTVTTINRPPVADAGLDQTIHAGRVATLDGSSSSDPDGDAVTYLWAFASIPAGSAATLSDASAVNPTFVADKVVAYTVSLVVNDGAVDSPSDTVTVNAENTAPVAHAGSDQTAGVGDTVSLNGSGSADADGDPITYSWSLTSRPSGSAATLTNANTESPAFVVDIAGAYEASLTVNDGFADSAPDAVTVTASAPMPDGLQALYPFNEGSGTTAHDASGNGRDGVVHGATWTAGKESGGLNFNGKNHYVSIPTINNDELSLCAWFNKGAKDTKDKDVILGGYQLKTRRAQNEGFALSFGPSAPDTLEFTLVTQNSKGKRTQKIAKAKIPGSVGNWRHVAGVYDKETGKQTLYIDGKLVSTATHPANNVVSPLTRYTGMNIGCSLDAKGHYKGVIDDVRLYNRALSEQEINAIIQKPLDTGFVSR